MSRSHIRVPISLGQGRYVIAGVLGQGGVGTVYRATDLTRKREVAIKVLDPRLVGTNVEKRFLREGEAMESLGHPHIVQVYDVGRDGPFAWMAMELMHRGSVYSMVRKHGPLSVSWVVHVADHLLAGLERVHEAGLVHRDVKPGNVLLDSNDDVKLGDFGIVRGDGSELTLPGMPLGTTAYMSPEQMVDATRVTARSDLFAVGATLYALSTARAPEKLAWIEPEDADQALAHVPAAIREILRKSCALAPHMRYHDAAEFRTAFQPLKAEGGPFDSGSHS